MSAEGNLEVAWCEPGVRISFDNAHLLRLATVGETHLPQRRLPFHRIQYALHPGSKATRGQGCVVCCLLCVACLCHKKK